MADGICCVLVCTFSIAAVARYIINQEEHHSRQTFREEYLAFLKRFDVPYNPKYVFDPDDDAEA